MKAGRKHIVPLSKQAIDILKQVQEITGNTVMIFPHRSYCYKGMSENALLQVIKRIGYKEKTTTHGFRSLASTILNENNFNSDWIEYQLAHIPRDATRELIIMQNTCQKDIR